MKNSGKDEPTEGVQIGSISIETNEKCKEYYDKLSSGEVGIYEAFDLRMKNIHKYSTGLFCLLLIQACVYIILAIIVALIANICFHRPQDFTGLANNIINLWKYLSFILIVLFFALLAIYYFKGKNNEFEDFSKCSFINSDDFATTYEHIFKIIKNMKKFLSAF